MVSHRLKRVIRSSVGATAVLVTITSVPAHADPGNASEAIKQLRDLSRQAEQVTEEYKKAQDDHAAKQAELDRATGEAEQARQVADQSRVEEGKFRGQVDKFAGASFEGARLNKLSALLISKSPHDFLDRASALDVLAQDNNEALHHLSNARNQAESAEQRARSAQDRAARAEADANRIQTEIGKKKQDMNSQIAAVKQKYNSLSQQEQQSMSSGTNEGPIAGSGVAIQAVNAALSKQGTPYVYGAKGPNAYDCSGLVQAAYKEAGVSLPGSTKSQVSSGKSVSQSQLQPGDILFFYSSQSHNGIYIGGGKMVHAPSEGQDVKVENYKYVGNVTAIRRVAG